MKLSTILVLSFVFVGIVGSVGGASYFYLQSIERLDVGVTNQLRIVADSRANHVETYLVQNIERLKMFTSKTVLREEIKEYELSLDEDLLKHIKKVLEDQKEPIEEFERLCVIGLDGIILASTDGVFCGKDVSDKDFFVNGKNENGIYFDEEAGEKKMFVSGPFILDGEVVAVGITVIKLDVFEEIVKDRTGLGETGEVLVSVRGEDERMYLFERLFEEDAINQDIESEETAEPMKKALLGVEEVFENTLDYRDEEVIAVSGYVEIGGIGLVAKMDRKEAFGIVKNQLIKNSIILVILVSFFVSFLGFFVSHLVSNPIKKLTQVVDEITKGKLNIQLPKSGIFEIRRLTDSLNRILASLKLAILKTGGRADIGLGDAVKAKAVAEKRFKDLVSISGDWIWETDSSGRYTFVSGKTKEILGYAPEEIIGKTPSDFMSKEDVIRVGKIFKNAASKKLPIRDLENWNFTKEGKRVLLLTNGLPILDSQGKLEGYRGIDKDISDQKELEGKRKALREPIVKSVVESVKKSTIARKIIGRPVVATEIDSIKKNKFK